MCALGTWNGQLLENKKTRLGSRVSVLGLTQQKENPTERKKIYHG